ncbi:MAG TPA: zinc ribbon domain-containing protein, partial [Kofleriaceae bacterium]|nr:zinc ribbon domain-containing protein [Kofleriaceae bacterium]
MRCPACNTENTPDSRFCGGCGAKLALAEPRVAPTAKIPDDAPFQTPAPGAYTASVAPSTYAPGPISYAPPSMPPRAPSAQPIAPPPPARVPEASLSMAVPRRRTGLIATVVVIDLALAGAGGLLLAKGLEPPTAPAATATAPPPTPAPQTTAITPAPSPAPPPLQPAGSAADVAIGSALDHIATATPAPAP